MPSYAVNAINVGGFLLGEADRVLTLFSAERGMIKAVAKGARKPGTKMSGRCDLLCANKLFLSSGKTFEIITQAECIETFPEFRGDLTRMSYGLYYAELTQQFGSGLGEESAWYFDYLLQALKLQARSTVDSAWLCLEFEMGLLQALGYRPELTYCVSCREVLGDYNLGAFNIDLGGILCQSCSHKDRQLALKEGGGEERFLKETSWRTGVQITPLVWKNLVLAGQERTGSDASSLRTVVKPQLLQSVQAARRLLQTYIEHLSGRKLKTLDVLEQLNV